MIQELHSAYLSGKQSPVEVTEAYLSSIGERNPSLNAFLTVTREAALLCARKSEERYKNRRPLSPLDGIPFALKDNLCTEGIRTTAGSRLLADYCPPYSATAAARLSESGGVLLGKTNMDEFGFGNTGLLSAFGAVTHPFSPGTVVGGSSSGSAAAVAAGLCAFSLGSDTGGSVRLPAAFCGVFGLKPTWGSVSRFGLIAFASSLDTVGILARSAEDIRTVFGFLTAGDHKDTTHRQMPPHSLRLPAHPRIGILTDLLPFSSAAAANRIKAAAHRLETRGMAVTEYRFSGLEHLIPAYYTLSSAEAASNLARFDGVRFGTRGKGTNAQEIFKSTRALLGDEAKRRILGGNAALCAEGFREEYLRACAIRNHLKAEMTRAFEACDFLLCPVCPRDAWQADETSRYEDDLCTVPASLAGLPALTVPFEDGAVQLIGPDFAEELLLDAALLLEEVRA